MIAILKLAATAMTAAIYITFPVFAGNQGIAPIATDTVQARHSPATVDVGFGGPGADPALKDAPEGTVEQVSGPEVPGQQPAAYTDKDLYVLTHVICGEAQGYPDSEQMYVGSVVLNRMNSGRYPSTIEGVVFQDDQYACIRDGNYYRDPTAANWANAKWLLEHGSVLPDNVVYQSGARQGQGVYLQTAYHYYCY